MKGTSGYCFSFGSGIFSWCSRNQEIIAQPTVEAKFVVAVLATNQALWLRKLMINLQMEQTKSTTIFVDNLASISIANNLLCHGRTKHFKIKIYFLREDILTKALSKAIFEYLREKLGV